jgi:hypothetical protein
MNKYLNLLILLCLIVLFDGNAYGGQTGTAVAAFYFQEINEIAISGSPTLTINSAVPGHEPQPVLDTSSSYAITTNGTNKKLTASIDRQMPANTTLEIQCATPGVGASKGFVALSTVSADVVNGISHIAATNKVITYRFSATTAAGIITSSCTVTLTLTD